MCARRGTESRPPAAGQRLSSWVRASHRTPTAIRGIGDHDGVRPWFAAFAQGGGEREVSHQRRGRNFPEASVGGAAERKRPYVEYVRGLCGERRHQALRQVLVQQQPDGY